MASLIATHTRSILNPKDQFYDYNCRVWNYCPLQHKCLTPGIVYQLLYTWNCLLKMMLREFIMVYVTLLLRKSTGIIPVPLKIKKKKRKRNDRGLSNYILALKNDKIVPSIKWKILRIVCGKRRSNCCGLCLTD